MSGELRRIALSNEPCGLIWRQLASMISSKVILTLVDEGVDGQFEC